MSKKKTDNYFLDKHKEWMEKGRLTRAGLCLEFYENEVLELFRPTDSDEKRLERENRSSYIWADGRTYKQKEKDQAAFPYTPLRQTIVLFCHEILNS